MEHPATNKRELLEQLLKQRGFNLPPVEKVIPRRKRFSPSLMSFAQQRLWFLHQLESNSSAYHVPAAFLLEGELKVEALSRSLNRIIERHETLRTSFGHREGQPCQLIAAQGPLTLWVEDLSTLEPAERKPAALARARAEIERPFDLRQAPQLRVRLLRLSEQEHILLLVLHHIVCDAWSLEVLFEELEQFYNSEAEADARELPIQYADYALWQRERLQGPEMDAQLEYWREQFRGELPVLELPADRVRPAVQSYCGGVERRRLGHELTAGLEQLGRQQGATLFMVLLAAFQTLLWRYTGQEQIVVGTPVANRQWAEVEKLIGFFVNTLALGSRVRGEQRFTEFLAQVKETCVGAYEHQELPFERLVEELQPERSLAHSPLFQVMLTMRSDQRRPLRLRGIEATPLSIDQTTAKFDWVLFTFINGSGLQTALEYNSDLFDRSTAKRVLAHYKTLLQGLVANPRQRLSELPLLTKSERRELLLDWNNTRTEFPLPQSLPELFEAQVEKTPDAPAVTFESAILSYRELNRRANQLAHYLRTLGVGPDTLVGVCLERSIEMVIGLLGILKAGGAYLPLDSSQPKERLSFVIEDAQLSVVLTEEKLYGLLPDTAAKLVIVDSAQETIRQASTENPLTIGAPANLAYVIYTSGSTGKPKGVMITHQGLVNYLSWCTKAYDAAGGNGSPVHSPLGFDLTVTSLFSPLLTGRSVILVAEQPGIEALVAALREHDDFSLVKLTPAHLDALELYLAPEEIAGKTRALIIGGEALSGATVSFWQQHAPSTRLINEYGPTETVVGCCVYEVPDNTPIAGPVPIGTPIANTQLFVLNPSLTPVPVGVTGELYIGGHGLARGYLNRPELTAEKFIPNPFGTEPGTRLYRSGDLARYRADGNIEYLGRIDRQVKIRGYRIELDEIEAVIAQHPAVSETVVAVREYDPNAKQLIAYLVPKQSNHQWSGPRELIDDVRSFVKQRLPDYMTPVHFMALAALPLTPNGKVDYRALPDPDRRGTPEEAYVAPQTELEQSLAQIWQEVLRVERVGLHDNFFDLGGHSLLLVQVHNKLRERLEREVSMLELFKYPTISLLSKHLGPQAGGTDGVESWLAQVRQRIASRRHSAEVARDVAIIGIAGRFPGAGSVEEFWQNLRRGVESIREFSEAELRAAGISEKLLQDDRYVRAGSIIDEVEFFDAEFFGITPREAEIMDPQQRLFLECAWEAIENAGYDPSSYQLPIGIFAGVSMNTYLPRLYGHPLVNNAANSLQKALGNEKDFISTRVSYKFGLTGPSLTVQTACSTSLVAVHLACQSLLAGECSMALAGGVSVRFPQKAGYLFQEGGIKSPDGHCRAFDARAAGTVGGSGVGLVLLKPLAAALADGDAIHAVIKGSAINNDGALKIGYTAPSITGQAAVIAEAQMMGGVSPETISYVEAHGTGTPLGDPIEVAALTQVFGKQNGRGSYCALGSVKTNIGHLDAAAGVAGLIKTILALKHEELPPSLHYERPNPEIDFEHSSLYVNAELRPWQRTAGQPRRAGVSSFGIGGTNAHVILEEAPAASNESAAGENDNTQWNWLVLSARNEESLKAAQARLADHLEQHPEQNLADVAYTLQVGRRAFARRAAVVCRNASEAITALRGDNSSLHLVSGEELPAGKGVVFLFPGQGAQHVNMGRSLYEAKGEFRRVVDECAEAAFPILGHDLRAVLYPLPGNEEKSQQQLRETAVTQVALFAVEYALAEQLRVWGVRPAALLGHSLGEYVAACVSGTFSMEQAITLVAERGRLMQTLPRGVMLAVALDEPELREALSAVSPGPDGQLWITALNGPQRTVAGGGAEAIEALEQYLNDKQVRTQRLQTSHAFHTGLVEPVLDQYRAVVERTVRYPDLHVRYVSNTSGRWAAAAEVQQADYWVQHMRQPVRFRTGVTEIAGEGNWLWLEVGPGQTLSRLVRQQLRFLAGENQNGQPRSAENQPHILTTLGDGEGDQLERTLRSLAQLWTGGAVVDWDALRATARKPRRVWLPGYQFQRERFWLEPPIGNDREPEAATAEPENKSQLAEWFYMPSWKRSMPLKSVESLKEQLTWLIFIDQSGLGSHLVTRLKKSGQRVVSVVAGSEFTETESGIYVIDPREKGDYEKLLRALQATNQQPQKVVHLWTVSEDCLCLGFESLEHYQRLGFFSLLYLAQALDLHQRNDELRIEVVSTDLHVVTGEEQIRPEKATLLGACKVISQEFQRLSCRSIDVRCLPGECPSDELVDQLLAEFVGEATEALIAYRREHRWVQSFEPVELKPASVPFKSKGVYLITGGLGGIGLTIAEHLGRSVQARLVLTGRSPLSDREAIARLEKAGAEVFYCQADVADEAQMRRVVELATQQFGTINGVIHAAGIAGGGIIQRRTREMMESVLAPKTVGTLVLDRVFKDQPLDFMVLCSSISSILGGVGGADYCAANSFLDAYAQYRGANAGVFSINWDKWLETGMAVNTRPSRQFTQDVTQQQSGHPLIGTCTHRTATEQTFETVFSAGTIWLLREHRIRGQGVVPGTAYLEMARAALAQFHSESRPIEIREITFAAPLAVADDDARTVQVRVTQSGEAFDFAIDSKPVSQNGTDSRWVRHVGGTMNYVSDASRRSIDLQAIKDRCVEKDIELLRNSSAQRNYGPRWQTVKQIYFGKDEGLGVFELPEEYADELRSLTLHPALLDFAMGFLAMQYLDQEAYRPFNYHQLRIKAPLQRRLCSYAKLKPNDDPQKRQLAFELLITDQDGNELIEVEQFTMRRVIENEQKADHGLRSTEGIEVLERVLASSTLPQIVVSTRDFPALCSHYEALKATAAVKASEASAVTSTHARPALANSYEAPRNEMEETIADILQRVLGIEKIGVFDDFLDLGGDSLIALQLMSRLREAFNVEPPLAHFFETPTISNLALLVVQQLAESTDQGALSEILLELEQSSSKPAARAAHD